MKYTGLSLSLCVLDIARGRVSIDQVDKIIASTAANSSQDWYEVIEEYKKYYWSENPKECEHLAREFIAAGKVEQPRLQGKEAHNIANGHWLINGVQKRL